jgi:hypothetical protein
VTPAEWALVAGVGGAVALAVGLSASWWMLRREARAAGEAYSRGYGDGYLDRDKVLRPDAGKGGPQVLEGDQ